MKNRQTPSFITKIIFCIKSPKFYSYLIKQPLNKAFGYIILLALILGGIYGSVIAYRTNNYYNETLDFLKSSDMPEFHLSEGILNINIDKPVIIEDTEVIIIIDMTDTYTYNDLVGHTVGYLITPERIIISQANNPPVVLNFSDFYGITLSNQAIIDAISSLKGIILTIIVIAIIIGTILLKLIESLFASLIALIANATLMTDKSYNDLYKISIYSLTFPSILVLIINILPINIPLIMMIMAYFGIITIYIVTVLKAIRNTENKIEDNNGDNSLF